MFLGGIVWVLTYIYSTTPLIISVWIFDDIFQLVHCNEFCYCFNIACNACNIAFSQNLDFIILKHWPSSHINARDAITLYWVSCQRLLSNSQLHAFQQNYNSIKLSKIANSESITTELCSESNRAHNKRSINDLNCFCLLSTFHRSFNL